MGVTAAIGHDQYKTGQEAGRMVEQGLKGENVNDIPVLFPSKPEIKINLLAANKFGLIIPDEILKNATQVVQ